jgi:hypothetical protein
MSMEVLKNDDIVQKPAHDLESVFYVLLYFCMQYKGPGMCRDKTDINKLTSYCIGTWFEPNTFDILALRKRDHLEDISKRFVAKFDPYFADLSDCMLQLWDVLFPPDMTAKGIKYRGLFKCEATHDGMLKILRHTYHNLPEVDPPAPPSAAVAKPTASTRKPPTCKKSQKASSQAASSSRAAFSSRKASSSRNASSSRQVSPPETRSSNGRKRHAPDAPDDPIGAQPSSSNHRVGDREASLHSGPAKRIRSTSEKKA